MNKLIFVRLVATGALVAGLGASTALADSGSINTTGPGSTNIVTSSSGNWYNQNTLNNAVVGNYNNQRAYTGAVGVSCNTSVGGGGYGSGDAYNTNYGQNTVNIDNDGGSMPYYGGGYGGGSNDGSIYLTGPYSTNRISSNNTNRFNSSTTNNVTAANNNNQQASSGGVYVTGNTLVTGVGGSGNAGNSNSGTNNVNIENSAPSPTPSWSGGGSGNSAGIAVTGPGSYNSTQYNNSSSTNLKTVNDVSATNSNTQNAQSGPVYISGNTVVEGAGGSGSAYNSNTAENDVGVSN